MVDLLDHPLTSRPIEGETPIADAGVVSDRRRPGRLEWINPALLHLFRGPAQSANALPHQHGQSVHEPPTLVDINPDEDSDALAAGQGMVVALLLSIPFWLMFGLGVWMIF
jgi:hypothetical protein